MSGGGRSTGGALHDGYAAAFVGDVVCGGVEEEGELLRGRVWNVRGHCWIGFTRFWPCRR